MTALLLFALLAGDVRPLTLAQVCGTRWSVDQRHVSTALRQRVFARDGICWCDRARYVVDHKIPREIGGADVLENLWVQSKAEAHTKDRLEGKLHRLVCDGSLLLKTAQDEIRTDWKAAYQKYLGDVPPSLPLHHSIDRLKHHGKDFGELSQRRTVRVASTDLTNVSSAQLRLSNALADRLVSARFSIAVKRIISVRPQKQMIRPNAGWSVASVQDAESDGDRAIRQTPRNAMRFDFSHRTTTNERSRDVAVAVDDLARPQPTVIGFRDVLPEIAERVDTLTDAVTSIAAEATRQRRTGPLKAVAADITDAGDRHDGWAESTSSEAHARAWRP